MRPKRNAAIGTCRPQCYGDACASTFISALMISPRCWRGSAPESEIYANCRSGGLCSFISALQPRQHFRINFLWVGDANTMRNHCVPIARRLETPTRILSLVLEADVESIGRRRLKDPELLCGTKKIDVRSVGFDDDIRAELCDLRDESVGRLAPLRLFAREERVHLLCGAGLGCAGLQQHCGDRGCVSVPEREVALQPCHDFSVRRPAFLGRQFGEVGRSLARFRLDVVEVRL